MNVLPVRHYQEHGIAVKLITHLPRLLLRIIASAYCSDFLAARGRASALLAAALDVQLKGHDALKNHLDPVTGAMFEYVAVAGGFALRSTWKVDDALRTKWS
jgi:hypothetical protein